jgi:hypothetical protein
MTQSGQVRITVSWFGSSCELGMLCAQTDGVDKLVKSLNVLSWEDARELNPKLTHGVAAEAAE